MGLNNLVRTRWFRNFMSKLYGWGASVVILGALFKINHYPGADYMLIAGLGTEALIFFFSAFEPPYVEPDWSLVYPQLAGIYRKGKGDQKKPTEELDDMLKEANIDQDLISRLGDGFRTLSDRTSKLAEVSDAASATNEYVTNIKSASESAGELTNAYKNTSESLRKDAGASEEYVTSIKSMAESANTLSGSYRKANETLESDVSATKDFTESIRTAMQSANNLAEQYSRSADILSKSAEKLDFSSIDGGSYNDQLQKITSNLSALNSVYELQMQSSNEQVESARKVRETMSEFLGQMKDSAEMMSSYREQMSSLNERLEALNNIYGGMLSAMNPGSRS
jgi:gliding motility-associated protein GldL